MALFSYKIIKSIAMILSILCYGCSEINTEKYNVILIVIDTLRADHLSCYGYSRKTSPNLDKLSKEAILFKNMIAQSSWTRPATASILTGLYPKNHGANTRDDKLASSYTLLSEILKDSGFNTVAFVANGNVGPNIGFDQGYAKFLYLREDAKKKEIHVRSDEVNKKVISYLEGIDEKSKNFIYVHYMDPHSPYLPAEKHFSVQNQIEFDADFFEKGRLQSITKPGKQLQEMIDAYDDEILYNDKTIGNLLQELKNRNLYDNSIIIITSDHGEEFLDHNGFTHGGTLYDEQIKVPLIIRLPNGLHNVIEKLVNQIDILPTILSALEVPIPPTIDGVNALDQNTNGMFSYSELDLDGRILWSVRSLKEKLIEQPKSMLKEGHFKWFSHKATFEFDKDFLEIHIASFNEERTIRIIVDEKVYKQLIIRPGKQTVNLTFPTYENRKITVESLTPCKKPKDLGLNLDERCLSFCIFDSSNFIIKNTYEHISKFYFSIEDDPLEKKNLYTQNGGEKLELEKLLQDYRSVKNARPSNPEPITYDKEQLEALKALGYIK